MKITVTGTRGIPDVLGGVESHCQHLYPEIKAQYDTEICVIARSPYVSYQNSEYKGVQTKAIDHTYSHSGWWPVLLHKFVLSGVWLRTGNTSNQSECFCFRQKHFILSNNYPIITAVIIHIHIA